MNAMSMKWIATLLPFLAACSSSYMRDAAPTDPPGPDEAKIVILRDAFYAIARTFPIYDGDELLGFSEYGSYFECRRKPGHHLFLAWGETDGAVQADLAGSRTYYLQFNPKAGFFSAGASLQLLPPGPHLDARIKGLVCRELIPERGDSWMTRHHEKAARKVEYYEGQGKARCVVLKPEDGR
jgi:hypothetical protein